MRRRSTHRGRRNDQPLRRRSNERRWPARHKTKDRITPRLRHPGVGRVRDGPSGDSIPNRASWQLQNQTVAEPEILEIPEVHVSMRRQYRCSRRARKCRPRQVTRPAQERLFFDSLKENRFKTDTRDSNHAQRLSVSGAERDDVRHADRRLRRYHASKRSGLSGQTALPQGGSAVGEGRIRERSRPDRYEDSSENARERSPAHGQLPATQARRRNPSHRPAPSRTAPASATTGRGEAVCGNA